MAFVGADAGFMHSGVYVAFPPGAIFPIADTTIQTPGQPAGTFFDFFLNVSISGSAVAFRGLYGTKLNDGIFAAFPPNPCAACAMPINMIADVNTAVPGGVGNFEGFGNVAIDPTNVAFEGVSNNGSTVKGIYTNAGGGLTKIIDTTDMLGGKQVSGVNLGPGGFSGDQVAFEGSQTARRPSRWPRSAAATAARSARATGRTTRGAGSSLRSPWATRTTASPNCSRS